MNRNFLRLWVMFTLLLLVACQHNKGGRKPNILLIMSDNQYVSHLGIYGDRVVKTPEIDELAKQGARFENAFCAAPSCTPSRAGLLTGQDIWRLKEGANLWGTLDSTYATYAEILAENGYSVGMQGKGWGPGNYMAGGRNQNPGGPTYPDFATFLKNNVRGRPWAYWFSSHHPHRPYEPGAGKLAGISPEKVVVPSYLPDTKSVRADITDYYAAIEAFDKEVGGIIAQLKASGDFENTLIVICSDNGWQMPRGLGNLYDAGTHVPLIIVYDKFGKAERVLQDFVNLNDLAPTFLELAGITIPSDMTARSLIPVLRSERQLGVVDTTRNTVYLARERHAFVRHLGLGYPARALRNKSFLYIHNYSPDRWPAGDPPLYGDVDANMLNYPSPTKVEVMQLAHKPDSAYFLLAFARRPAEELYDLKNDPDQLKNLADKPAYANIKKKLAKQLLDYQVKSGDPRTQAQGVDWDKAAYYKEADKRPKPSKYYQQLLGLDSVYNYLKE
ncbi:Arylsulfatase A [bacterium A37T11]|nr:Arylsulfatase A [bacterium A37T11]